MAEYKVLEAIGVDSLLELTADAAAGYLASGQIELAAPAGDHTVTQADLDAYSELGLDGRVVGTVLSAADWANYIEEGPHTIVQADLDRYPKLGAAGKVVGNVLTDEEWDETQEGE